MHTHIRLFFLVLLSLALCGCPSLHQGTGGDAVNADTAWGKFTSRADAAALTDEPFRITTNLRYTGKNGENARVSGILWGNNTQASPLRLDMTSSIGTTVANVREDKRTFSAYSVSENTLYTHPRGQNTLVTFGVPIPLTLHDLTLLMTGKGGTLFLPANKKEPTGQTASEKGTFFPVLKAPLAGIIELSEQGIPLSWREPSGNGWIITFEPDATAPMRPRRLIIRHPDGYEAIIVVKDISTVPQPFNEEQLTLNLPRDVQQRHLDNPVESIATVK